MSQGTIRSAMHGTSPTARDLRAIMGGKMDGRRNGDRYTDGQIARALGPRRFDADARLAADQRSLEIQFNAWVREQERQAA